MIKNIIFDFGDIFINLNKTATVAKLSKQFGAFDLTDAMQQKNDEYEMGLITTNEFVSYYQNIFPKATAEELIDAWNAILLDIPAKRLTFIQKLAQEKRYRLFLLSNTNALHIEHIKNNIGIDTFNAFEKCFEQFYLSHQIHLRKPNASIFEYVIKNNELKANETLFIDDTLEHIETAKSLGLHTWNLIPGKEDVTELFNKKLPL